MHPLTGQQQLAGLSGQHSSVVTQHPGQSQLRKGLMAKGGSCRANIALRQQATAPAQGVHKAYVIHAAAKT